jgi:hypothetical protein
MGRQQQQSRQRPRARHEKSPLAAGFVLDAEGASLRFAQV